MKCVPVVICLSVMLLFSGCAASNNDTGGGQAGETIPVETENQLLPPQGPSNDTEFDKAYQGFVSAVNNKDLTALDRFLDEKILSSFGGDPGKTFFYEHWNLNNNPDSSELWTELGKIIKLGGSYNTKDRTFTAPYTYSNFPNEFDAFQNVVAVDKKVSVYEKEDLGSNVIAYLNYNIIKVDEAEKDYWNKKDQDLIKIKTPSGKEGYVQKQYTRSPMDYRLSFNYKGNDGWKLTFLVAGD